MLVNLNVYSSFRFQDVANQQKPEKCEELCLPSYWKDMPHGRRRRRRFLQSTEPKIIKRKKKLVAKKLI